MLRKKKKLLIFPLIIVIILSVSIFTISSSITNQMNQSATSNIKETLQIIADNLSQMRQKSIESINNFASTLRLDDQLMNTLQQAKEQGLFIKAAVIDANTKKGIYDDGTDFELSMLEYEEKALRGVSDVSEIFLSNQGAWAFGVQCPIYENDKVVGALYANISIEQFENLIPSDIYDEGVLYMFDTNTFRFVSQPLQTDTHYSGKYDLNNFLDDYSDLEDTFREQIISSTKKGNEIIVSVDFRNQSTYMFFWPVPDSDLYLCGLVPVSSIQKESDVVITTIRYLTGFTILGSVAIMIFIFLYLREQEKNRRKIYEREEHEQRYRIELFNGIARSIGDAVLVYDVATGVNEINFENIKKIIGVEYDQLQEIAKTEQFQKAYAGTIFKAILSDGEFNQQNVQERLEWENPETRQHQWIRIEILYVELTGIMKCILTIFDLTQEVLLQDSYKDAALAAQNASNVKSDFLSRMSHEIRTPMNAISGMIQIAANRIDTGGDVKESLKKAEMASEQLLMLINDILDLSKIESGKMNLNEEWFELDNLLETIINTISFHASMKQQELKICNECKNLYLYGDSIRLSQILVNLLTNAVKYTPKMGRIECTVLEREHHIKDSVSLDFIIKDNGVGISEEFQKTMFTPFTQEMNNQSRSEKGTGLGLSIVHNLVSLMGGFIKVESTLDIGTAITVSLRFKCKQNEKIVNTEVVEEEKIDLSKYRILLVEDNELNLEITKEFLEQANAIVECASNGLKAYEKFKESPIGYYQCILMDMHMPEWDGIRATKEIRKLDRSDAKDIYIIAATANTFEEDEEQCLDAGMNDFIMKPINMYKLHKKIKNMKGESQ